MANEEQAPPKQRSDIEWWGDIDAQMANVKTREAITSAVLGKELHVAHNATGPWYAWESPTHEWFESDKVFWAYDFHTDDLWGTLTGNSVAQFFIGLFIGARQPTMATEVAMNNASITYANDAVRKVEEAEIEGLYKPPKKVPMTLVYGADGELKGKYVFVDFPKEGILPGAYPGMPEGACNGSVDDEDDSAYDIEEVAEGVKYAISLGEDAHRKIDMKAAFEDGKKDREKNIMYDGM
jgi:hypothetical protein